MKFKHYYDLTVTIAPEMVGWEGDPPVELKPFAQISEGEIANVTEIRMGTHTGTHMDAPRHFLDTANGVDTIPLDVLIGTAYVLEFRENRHITAEDLASAHIPPHTKRLLLKTPNSRYWLTDPHPFHRDFVALAPSAAQWLIEKGVKLVGIDYLSIEPYDTVDYETHYRLLNQNVVIIEALNLSNIEIETGEYFLMALPLKLKGADGAPTRVVLAR
jgi:arylformamidase